MAYVPATQRHNGVEVSGGLCDVVCGTSVLKTPQNNMGKPYFTAQDKHCALFSIHCMCNSTHTKSRGRIKCVGSDVDKDTDYWGIKIIWFKLFSAFTQWEWYQEIYQMMTEQIQKLLRAGQKPEPCLRCWFIKDRDHCDPSIALTSALDNHKESTPIGDPENRFIRRK